MRRRSSPRAVVLAVTLLAACATSRAPASGDLEEGLASWYGEPYHGRPTASGTIYNQRELTAAHRTLPFGTRLRVHDLENGRHVDVLVNDRGPFVAGRILDLSRGAAEALDLVRRGVAPVRLEVLEWGDGMPAAPCWEVQVGAFAVQANVERAGQRLRARGLGVHLLPASGGLTRVRIAASGGRPAAEALAQSLVGDYPGAAPVPCS
ncbi:MAG TPA: septal ring lytic transglycosylase RlpA family protein [Thermoanaerobaculaceae bacterium]|nr:septal ring lytic transglycosylase RlpA family protein [Thermoanaerobaculaceae bacterium]HPS78373.1 septal ring lytic transglycosylase RlpA family protein [Thermoanaerobaculaceae bacterium]